MNKASISILAIVLILLFCSKSSAQTVAVGSTEEEAYLIYSKKKGIGLVDRNDSITHKRKIEDLHLGWYWNWSVYHNEIINPAIEYVPSRHSKWWPSLEDLPSAGVFHNLLTYNEPYQFDSNDPTPQEAYDFWPEIEAAAAQYGQPGTRIGSPTTKGINDAFQVVFMPMALAGGLKIDFINNHRYPKPSASLKKLKGDAENLYAKYGLPIWQTEWSPADWSNTAGYTHAQSYTAIAEVLHYYESTHFVERYAIFPWSYVGDSPDPVGYSAHLWETNEGYIQTPIGKLYANYRSSDVHGPYTNTVYYIHNKRYHQRLVDNGSGTPTCIEIHYEGDPVDFELDYADNGSYFITNRSAGNHLAYSGHLLFWTPEMEKAAMWTLSGSENGWHYIDNVKHGQRLIRESERLSMAESSTDGDEAKWAFIRSNADVVNSNSHPEFSSDTIALKDAVRDLPYSASLNSHASDNDGDPLSFAKAVLSGPSWLKVVADGKLSGTPGPDDVGANSWIVLVDDGTGGTAIAVMNILVRDTGTAVKQFESKDTRNLVVRVFPQPASELLNLVISNCEEKFPRVSFYNLQGQLLRSIDLDLNGKRVHQLSLDDFSAGLYILHITTVKGDLLGTERIVII